MSTGLSFAGQLRTRRGVLGLTQAELAERAGISERAVSDMERGLRRVVYRDTAQRLVRALELTGEEANLFVASARGRTTAVRDQLPALPLPRMPLIGRSSELAEVVALLQDSSTRVITLTGPGGVGKTRLALEVGSSLQEGFAEGAVLVSLGELQDPQLVMPVIAGALRVRSAADVVSALAGHLQGRRLLLILDTFEHLLAAAPALAELVASSFPTKLLVTSRLPLNISAERLVQVKPLAQADAVAMFAGCIRSQQPASADSRDDPIAADICRRLDGLPLGIELAAARARTLGLAEVRLHLERRLVLLQDGPVDFPERQRSMRATMAWSYDLLASDDRRLLEQLSVFAGGWTMESAGVVSDLPGDLITRLARLVDSSLVLADPSGPDTTRYRMLDTLREYASERLDAHAGATAVHSLRRRHAHFFVVQAEQAEPNLRAGDHRRWAARLAADHDNLRAALGWAVSNADAETALRLGRSLWMFWRLIGAFSEGRVWLRQVLDLDARGLEPLRAGVLWGAGWLAYQQGDFQETASRGAELVEWARGDGDTSALRNGLTLQGEERLGAGDLEAAGHSFEEALAIARKTGSPWLVATSCLNRSVAAQLMGELDQANGLLAEAETLYREVGDDRFVARVFLQRAYVALLKGDWSRARELAVAGLSSAAGLDDPWGIAEQLDGMAAVLAAKGDRRGAAFVAGAAETAWESIGAGPHPADRRSTDLWLIPVLEAAGNEADAAFAQGRTADRQSALARALGG